MGIEHFEILDAEVIRETPDAILVDSPDLDEPVWFPKRGYCIMEDSEVWDGSVDGCGPGTLVIAMKWAEKKGLV